MKMTTSTEVPVHHQDVIKNKEALEKKINSENSLQDEDLVTKTVIDDNWQFYHIVDQSPDIKIYRFHNSILFLKEKGKDYMIYRFFKNADELSY